MNFNQYKCGYGVAVPVFPIGAITRNGSVREFSLDVISENNKQIKAFETWLSTQPTIYADPSIKDGVYAKGLFEEPVWQYFDLVWQYLTERQQPYILNEKEGYVTGYNGVSKFDARLYIRLKQPITNVNNCNEWAKDLCNCNYLKDCKHNKQPIKQEEKVYTFFKIEFNNFSFNDGDYDIFKSMSDMQQLLHELEAELDTPNDPGESEKSITITGVAMTQDEFDLFKQTQYDDQF